MIDMIELINTTSSVEVISVGEPIVLNNRMNPFVFLSYICYSEN